MPAVPHPSAAAAANLPSGKSAQDLIDGRPGALAVVLAHLALRSMIGGLGLALVGFRGRDLVLGSLAVGASIELFVVGHRAVETLLMQHQAAQKGAATAAAAGLPPPVIPLRRWRR